MLSRRVLCADWDAWSLRLVVAKVGASMALEDAHSYRVPDDVDHEDPQALGGFIGRVIKRHGWRHRRVIVDVPRDKAVINRMKLPPTPMDDLAAAVQFQALRELPFPAEAAAIDFLPTQRDANGAVTEVMLAGTRREGLKRIEEVCHAAGLTPTRIGLRPYANLVSVSKLPSAEDQCVLLVDVGPQVTELDVIHDGVLTFSRVATVDLPRPRVDAGDDAGDDADAEHDTLRLVGSDYEAQLDQAVRQLVVEVTRTLQMQRAADADATVSRIIVAGGTNAEPPLLEALEERFGIPCEVYDPTESLALLPEDGRQLRAFSAVLGLAWGLSRDGELAVDFLNPKKPTPRGAKLKRRARLVGVAVGTAAIGAAAAGIVEWRQQASDLAAIKRENSQLRQRQAELKRIDAQVQRIQEMPDPVWIDDLLAITQLIAQPEGEDGPSFNVGEHILVQSITFDAKSGGMVVDVAARSNEDLTRLEQALNAYTRHGKPVFSVQPFGWVPESDVPGFAGETRIDIVRLDLANARTEIEQAERRRSKELRG